MLRDETTPVILSACRTPIGKYLGGLSPLPAPRLGALVIREAVRRAGIEDGAIEGAIVGNVLQGGVGQEHFAQKKILNRTASQPCDDRIKGKERYGCEGK